MCGSHFTNGAIAQGEKNNFVFNHPVLPFRSRAEGAAARPCDAQHRPRTNNLQSPKRPVLSFMKY